MKWLQAALVSLIKAIIYQYFDDDDRLTRSLQKYRPKRGRTKDWQDELRAQAKTGVEDYQDFAPRQQWPQQVIWQAKQGMNAFGVLDTMEVVEEEQVAKLMGILEDDGAEKGGEEEDDSEDNDGPKDTKQEAQI
ncbi:MAG: hypothetical protein Q9181_007561 [Wetmoreana brouardii]